MCWFEEGEVLLLLLEERGGSSWGKPGRVRVSKVRVSFLKIRAKGIMVISHKIRNNIVIETQIKSNTICT